MVKNNVSLNSKRDIWEDYLITSSVFGPDPFSVTEGKALSDFSYYFMAVTKSSPLPLRSLLI